MGLICKSLEFSMDPLVRTCPIAMGPTFHRPNRQMNGPNTMQQQFERTYNFADYEMGPI